MDLIIFCSGLLIGYLMAVKRPIGEIRHTIRLDARDAIKNLKDAERAVKDLEKELW